MVEQIRAARRACGPFASARLSLLRVWFAGTYGWRLVLAGWSPPDHHRLRDPGSGAYQRDAATRGRQVLPWRRQYGAYGSGHGRLPTPFRSGHAGLQPTPIPDLRRTPDRLDRPDPGRHNWPHTVLTTR